MCPVRVLIVDDSVVIRKVLGEALASDPEVQVAATAPDGSIALSKIALVNPDIVTLDVEMPGMSGLETLIAIRRLYPRLPVIMFSTLTERGAAISLEALSLGANDCVTKPQGNQSVEETRARICGDLIPKVKELCLKRVPDAQKQKARAQSPKLAPRAGTTVRAQIVAIGTSTGGPNALAAAWSRAISNLRLPHSPISACCRFRR
jgi:two-component system, chemotaxis family, protein-glutamate methylesterase/glutaminase